MKGSKTLVVVMALVGCLAGVSVSTQAAHASVTYGPNNASYAAYYANPSDQSTWSSFCSGAGDGASYAGIQALGVPACGPTPTNEEVGIDIGANGSGGPTPDFQCVEFAERYLYVTDAYAPINGTNGDQVVANYASANSLTVISNGVGQLPQVGAVMSFADNSSFNSPDGGHVAVVTQVTSSSVTVVGENQNGSGPYTDGSASMTITGNDYINDFNPSMPSIEWFNPPSGGGSGPPSNGERFVESGQTQQYIDWFGASLPLSFADAQAYDTEGNTQVLTDTTNFVSSHPASDFPSSTVVRVVKTSQQYFYIDGTRKPIGDPATSACLLYVRQQASPAVVPTMWADPIPVASPVTCNLPNGTIYYDTATSQQYFTWGSDVVPVNYGDALAYNADSYSAAIPLPDGYASDHTQGTLPPNTVVRAANSAAQYLWNGTTRQPVTNPAISACLTIDGASGVAVVPPSWLNAQTVGSAPVTCNLPNGTIYFDPANNQQFFTWDSDVVPLVYSDAVAYNAEGYPAAISMPDGTEYTALHTQGTLPPNTVVRAANSAAQYLWNGTTRQPVTNPAISACLTIDGASGVAVVPPSWLNAHTVGSAPVTCNLPNGTIYFDPANNQQFFTWGSDVVPLVYSDAVAYNAEGYPAAISMPDGTEYTALHTQGTLPANTVVRAAKTSAQYLWTGAVLQPVANPSMSTCLLDNGASGVAVGPPSWLAARRVSSQSAKCPVPVVSSISPTSGPTSGGTTVTVTGSGFGGATKVTFGTTSAVRFTVVSSTKITAVSPAESTGIQNVLVTTAGGTSAAVSGDRFMFR